MKKWMIFLFSLVFGVFGLLASACDDDDDNDDDNGSADADSDGDSDTGSDADADTDADADGDTDADSDPLAGYNCDNVDAAEDPCLNLACASKQAETSGVACLQTLIDCLQDGCKPGTPAAEVNTTVLTNCSTDFASCIR